MDPRSQLTIIALTICGCSADSETRIVARPGGEFAAAFLFITDLDGRTEAPRGPYDLRVGAGEQIPPFSVGPDQRAFVLGFDETILSGLHFAVDLSQTSQIELLPGTEPCIEGNVADDDSRVRLKVPRDGALFELTPERDRFDRASSLPGLDQWVLDVPLVPGLCPLFADRSLQPFGDAAHLLPDGVVIRGVSRTGSIIKTIVRLDQSRVLAVTGELLILLERAQPVIDDSAHLVEATQIAPGLAFSDIAVDRSNPESFGVFATLKNRERDPPMGAIAEVEVSEVGLTRVRTATVVGTGLSQAAIDYGGHRLATGATTILTSSVSGGRWRSEPSISVHKLAMTDDSELPHVVAARGAAFIGDLIAGTMSPLPFVDSIFGADSLPTALDVHSTSAGLEVWVGGFAGKIGRGGVDGVWSAVDYSVVAEAASWTYPTGCGRRMLADGIRAILLSPDSSVDAYVTRWSCPYLFAINSDTGCMTALAPAGVSDGAVPLRSLDYRDGVLTVGGGSGAVFELR